jgi:hypothetical protein
MASSGHGSQKKGKEFERAVSRIVSDILQETVRRTPSQERWKIRNQGDINAQDYDSILSRFHLELKCHNRINLPEFWRKTKDDSQNRIPVLITHLKNSDTLVSMKLEDWCRLLRELKGFL